MKIMRGSTALLLMLGISAVVFAHGGSEVGSPEAMISRYEHIVDLHQIGGLGAAEKLAENNRVVLFFHATWCPTCRETMAELKTNYDTIPDDVYIVIVDYDSNKALRKQYDIPYQHTFVYLAPDGTSRLTWNGGNTAEILGKIGG